MTKKYQELANEICAMWQQKAAQVIPMVISSMGVIPKSLSQSLTRQPALEYIYITAKICNSWHMFNCKKLFKLQIKPPSLILLTTTSQDRWIFPIQSWEMRKSTIIIIIIIIITTEQLPNYYYKFRRRPDDTEGGNVARMGAVWNSYESLVFKSEESIPFEISTSKQD